MKLSYIIKLLKDLIAAGFTGQVRVNFFKGKLSSKVEKKEAVSLEKVTIGSEVCSVTKKTGSTFTIKR